MPIAGKVMPRHRGAYDPLAVYDIIDHVTFNNRLWACKQTGTIGIEPNESNSAYWHLVLSGDVADASTLNGHDSTYFATQESVDAINLSLTNINAATLDGHGSEYFATKEDLAGVDLSNIDATTLDGHDSTYFATKDDLKSIDSTVDFNNLNAATLDGHDSTYFATKEDLQNVTIDTSNLDATTLDGHDSTYFATKEELSNIDTSTAVVFSNPNLFDNWDFRNPVNQTGWTTSSESEHIIDRWKHTGASTISLVKGKGISINALSSLNNARIKQTMPDTRITALGKPITFSMLDSDGNIYTAVINDIESAHAEIVSIKDDGPGSSIGELYISTVVIQGGGTSSKQSMNEIDISISTLITIAAVKLEVGTVSTLANDMSMNHLQELTKCMAYYQKVPLLPDTMVRYIEYSSINTIAWFYLSLNSSLYTDTFTASVENVGSNICLQYRGSLTYVNSSDNKETAFTTTAITPVVANTYHKVHLAKFISPGILNVGLTQEVVLDTSSFPSFINDVCGIFTLATNGNAFLILDARL